MYLYSTKHVSSLSSRTPPARTEEAPASVLTRQPLSRPPSPDWDYEALEASFRLTGTYVPDTMEEKNATRREARRQAAAADPAAAIQQRKECGSARATMVGEVWVDQFQQKARMQRMIIAIIGKFPSNSLAFLQAVVAAYMEATNQLPIPPSSPVWLDFIPAVVDFLCALTRHPTSLSFLPFLENSTIVESVDGDPAPHNSCQNYIRQIHVPQPTKALREYMYLYPATAPTTILQLMLQGADLASIEAEFALAMSEYGLEEAAAVLVKKARATKDLHGLHCTGSTADLPYAGITWTVPAWQRCWDDLRQSTPCMIVNFLKSQPDLRFRTYHIPSLDTPLSSSLDARTNPVVSEKERILRALLGAAAMNSADGGIRPVFFPSQVDEELRVHALAALPTHHPLPLGNAAPQPLQHRVRYLIDQERECLNADIAPAALAAVKFKVANVLRHLKGRLLKLEITKDIPAEAIGGNAGGYWDATVGRGPQEDRHLRRYFHPEIEEQGDLPARTIARYIGPFIDFWRLSLDHQHYWLNILFTSQYLRILRPLLIVSQSNPVATVLRLGDLVRVWQFLPPFPLLPIPDLHSLFPENVPCPTLNGSAFNSAIGTLSILRTGQDPAQLSLHLSRGDSGRLKYDTVLAFLRWRVDWLVTLMAEVVLQLISAELHEGSEPDWADAIQTRAFLEGIKSRAARVLSETGVTQALDVAKAACRKSELVVNLVRSLAGCKRRHERWIDGQGPKVYERRAGLRTAPSGPEREAQIDRIVAEAQELDSFDLPPDPSHLAPWIFSILSPGFCSWLRSLGDDKDIVYCANALGGSEEAYERVIKNRAAIGQWSKTNTRPVYVDTHAIARKNVINALRSLANPLPLHLTELLQSCRIATCQKCHSTVLAQHNAAYHRCVGEEEYEDKLVTEKNFPSLDRLLYSHEILGDFALLDEFGSSDDLLVEVGLVAVAISYIVTCKWFWDGLNVEAAFSVEDVKACRAIVDQDLIANLSIYLPTTAVDNRCLIITLTIDVLLLKFCTCQQQFLPQRPADRTNALYLVQCSGVDDHFEPAYVFISNKVKMAGDSLKLRDKRCVACNGSKACKNRTFCMVKTLWDLPSHFARQTWFNTRIGLERSDTRNLVKQLEDTLHHASDSPESQAAKVNIRSRLNGLISTLPPTPHNEQRATSEEPSPAQPRPRSPRAASEWINIFFGHDRMSQYVTYVTVRDRVLNRDRDAVSIEVRKHLAKILSNRWSTSISDFQFAHKPPKPLCQTRRIPTYNIPPGILESCETGSLGIAGSKCQSAKFNLNHPAYRTLSHKELKTIRCTKRAHSIRDTANKAQNVLEPKDFFTLIFGGHKLGTLEEEEDQALTRLLIGYDRSTQALWQYARGSIDLNTTSMKKFLEEDINCARVVDLQERIVRCHQNLHFQDSAQDIASYVRNLLQCINAIRFSLEITKLGAGTGGTACKTAVYQAMHEAERSAVTYNVWKRATEGRVTARNTLRKVYFAFGLVMLMDPFWTPRNLEPSRRSPGFAETLDELIKSIPNNEDGISPLAEMVPSTRRALKTVLDLFWPAVSQHVMSFCAEHPPNIAGTEDSDVESQMDSDD
ncbi:hypothetical protein B0H19DRAFT_1077536 [Mycena capillaripes]|nr:hypothetical protein B0H19DRAFT_1077536 [Mycena capillaripes]